MDSGWAVDAVNYAVEQGVRVTNLSWNFGELRLTALAVAYRQAYDAGIINFNSAGNGNADQVYLPGRFFEVHSVSGIDFTGELFYVNETFASNRGPDVEFTGPGRFVFALDRTGPAGLEDETGPYGADAVSVTGTSYACPHLAGIAALIRSLNPDIGPEEVAYILRESVLDLGEVGRDDSFGYGLCKSRTALEMAPAVITIRTFDRGDLSGWSAVDGN